jgi:ADP-ribose pyrophosphatase
VDDRAIDIRTRETAYAGFFGIDRYRLRQRHHDGWTPDRDAVVLIEQLRLPAHLAGFPARQIEIVAGLIDRQEEPAAVARREVDEETGLALIGDLIPIRRFLPSPGGSTETVELFCGRVDAGGFHGLAEEHEEIRVVVETAAAALTMLDSGAVTNATTLLALYWLAANRESLRQRWRRSE